MENPKVIKQTKGALAFTSTGRNHFVINWDDGMIELYQNGKRAYIIDVRQ